VIGDCCILCGAFFRDDERPLLITGLKFKFILLLLLSLIIVVIIFVGDSGVVKRDSFAGGEGAFDEDVRR